MKPIPTIHTKPGIFLAQVGVAFPQQFMALKFVRVPFVVGGERG
jgi:hypothetical protein